MANNELSREMTMTMSAQYADGWCGRLRWILWVGIITLLAGCSFLPFSRSKEASPESPYVQSKVNSLLETADEAYRLGNLTVAEDQYLGVLERNANQPRALYRLGNIAFKAAQYEKARDYFSRAINADPANSKAHYNLAVTQITLAQEHFKAYVSSEPDNANRDKIELLLRQIDGFAQGNSKSSATGFSEAVSIGQNDPGVAETAQSPAVTQQDVSSRSKESEASVKLNASVSSVAAPSISSPMSMETKSLQQPRVFKKKRLKKKPLLRQSEASSNNDIDSLDALANQLKKH